MEEEWRRYESLIIFDPEGGTEATEELVQRARNFVTQDSGRILKAERWGVRDLAFELKGRRKGYYLLLDYAGLPGVATELDRRLNLIDSVLKFQTIKLEDRVDPDSLPELEEVTEDAPQAEEAGAVPEGSEEPAPAPNREEPMAPEEVPEQAPERAETEGAVETEAVETEAVETEAVETKAVETEAVETKAVETEKD
jgi:small subunit ribosomal protein S6